jgi:drug/metabolite transporter (DMT)-like permease
MNTVTSLLVGVSVLGVIAICLFPLWPPEVRIGISYLSWLAMGLLGVILTLYIGKRLNSIIRYCYRDV